MNMEIISSGKTPVRRDLNWLLLVDTKDSPSKLEASLPLSKWRVAQHPVIRYGEVATLGASLGAPFEPGASLDVTFADDHRVSSVELSFGLPTEQSVRSALAEIADELGGSCIPILPPLEASVPIKDGLRRLEESWWQGDSFSYQMTAVLTIDTSATWSDEWAWPHQVTVRKFPLATMGVGPCAAVGKEAPRLEGPGTPTSS